MPKLLVKKNISYPEMLGLEWPSRGVRLGQGWGWSIERGEERSAFVSANATRAAFADRTYGRFSLPIPTYPCGGPTVVTATYGRALPHTATEVFLWVVLLVLHPYRLNNRPQ